jgi:uridine phosphorylase
VSDPAPILDFDPDPSGVLDPGARFKAGTLPERLVLTFFEPALQATVLRSQATVLHTTQTFGMALPVHGLQRNGQALALFQCGVGAAVAGGQLEELIALGARKILVCGGAGVLDRSIHQGHLILPTSALREEGLSYHYLPPSAEVEPGAQAVAALEKALLSRKAPYLKGKTWSTDGLYRETRGKVAQRRAQGCLSVEMEAAGLFAVAQFRKVQIAQLLYGGDDVSGQTWDHRGWQENLSVQEMMLEICIEAAAGM